MTRVGSQRHSKKKCGEVPGYSSLATLTTEETRSAKTLIRNYETTLNHIPGYSNFQQQRCAISKAHVPYLVRKISLQSHMHPVHITRPHLF